ncbi:Abi family protein [Yimella sp. RIT 621]|uniref:Abi family protein n=1 Tax=Yimella sp. RIT 621 TaxID=2510323 RepID=UPI00101D3EAF|nr:Abi family protein [Yimella sp. RIT 621]RYG78464.1 Abi family protein [Yimella sp. RIT 621]
MKPWLSWPDQVSLLQQRGLEISDTDVCEERLSRVNYYRFMGYARYFQAAPHDGNNSFVAGATFADVWALYEADEALRDLLMAGLGRVEIALRTTYAYVLGRDTYSHATYLQDSFFSGAATSESLAESCRADLNRSRERFILRYRDNNASDPYADLPVWSAVEAFSFGTLSKCVERAAGGTLHPVIAEELGIAKAGFHSRVKALVYVRNRCAHHARLWRHSVIDAGLTPNNARHKTKKQIGQFDPRSVMDVLVSLDDILTKTNLGDPVVPALLATHGRGSAFLEGLTQPLAHRDGRS